MDKKEKDKFFHHNSLRKNRKADIPVTILVIGTFVISSIALISFISSNASFRNSFTSVDLMEHMNSKISLYNYYKSKGIDPSPNIIEYHSGKTLLSFSQGDFILTKNETLGYWFWAREQLMFSCKYSLP